MRVEAGRCRGLRSREPKGWRDASLVCQKSGKAGNREWQCNFAEGLMIPKRVQVM